MRRRAARSKPGARRRDMRKLTSTGLWVPDLWDGFPILLRRVRRHGAPPLTFSVISGGRLLELRYLTARALQPSRCHRIYNSWMPQWTIRWIVARFLGDPDVELNVQCPYFDRLLLSACRRLTTRIHRDAARVWVARTSCVYPHARRWFLLRFGEKMELP
jgi:hypothetical protein